jgi:ubiquinone/menaquinone biosynthesis C-methylase UbiE
MGWFAQLRRMNNMVCPWWLCYSFDNPLRRLVHDPERLLAADVRSGMTVLDIGCGMGYFTLGMAKLVGPDGKVVAVDLQPQMLYALERRARKAGVADRIIFHRCRKDSLGLDVTGPADFALAFWMIHEVRDKPRFFKEILAALKPDGRLLLAEPKVHVAQKSFARTTESCEAAGFRLLNEPSISLSRALLMGKEECEKT